MTIPETQSSARRSRTYRERMRAAGYRAAEVWRLDAANPSVRERIQRQLQKLADSQDDADWMVEPEIGDWR